MVASIAINAHDQLAIFGTFLAEASIFGRTLTAPFALPSGRALGTFVSKLDGGGNVATTSNTSRKTRAGVEGSPPAAPR